MRIISSLMLIVCLTGCLRREPAKTTHRGERVPEFSLFLADSSTYFNTASLHDGKPVIFFYFGPSCPYSRGQMEDFISNARKLKDVQLVLLTTWPFAEMKWFYKHYQLERYDNMIVGVDYANFFNKYFNASGVPYIAIYDRNKKLKVAFDAKVPVRQVCNIALD